MAKVIIHVISTHSEEPTKASSNGRWYRTLTSDSCTDQSGFNVDQWAYRRVCLVNTNHIGVGVDRYRLVH